ncbi:MAG: helix-turn-helix domain-containing protein [Methylocella sp.]
MSGRPVELLPAATVAAEFHVTRRTVGRWLLDDKLGFPTPVEINKRLYFRRSELEAWKLSRGAACIDGE